MKWNEMKWNEMNEWMNATKWNEMKGNEEMKWMNEWMNEWMNQWINGSMNEWNEWNEWNQWMNGWMNKWNEWMNEWMNERMNEWMNARKRSEWMNARMNECSFDKGQPPLATTAATLPQKHSVSRPIVFSSLNSRVPNLLHVQTTWWWCGCHDVVDMMMWLANGNRALATVSCTFTDLIFQKGSETLRFF